MDSDPGCSVIGLYASGHSVCAADRRAVHPDTVNGRSTNVDTSHVRRIERRGARQWSRACE
jgi:hypothetical protein